MKKILTIILFVIVSGAIIMMLRDRPFYSDKHNETLVELYGKSFNPERIKRNLPIIEESWVVRISDSSHTQWSHESVFNSQNVPEHIWKTLYFNDATLVSEEDAFNYDQEGRVGDRLIIVSNLQKPDSIQFKFSRHYYESYPPSESVEVNFEFADSVLNKWGFKNLYIKSKTSVSMQ